MGGKQSKDMAGKPVVVVVGGGYAGVACARVCVFWRCFVCIWVCVCVRFDVGFSADFGA